MHQPKVSVVILNYNGKSWLEQFLPNVIQHTTYSNAEIIVADNASTDDSVLFLQQYFPDGCSHLGHGDRAGIFALRAVGERDLDHVKKGSEKNKAR